MCNACPPVNLDESMAGAFAQKMLESLNSAGLMLMVSVGYRLELFDRMAEMPAETSEGIASRTGLDERYVREWLGAMATGGIVVYDELTETYALPPEHASFLTRKAAPNNLASPAQWIAVLGGVESAIVDCFRNGGGVPYSSFDRFHEVMASESDQTVGCGLFDHILPLVPGGLAAFENGIAVLDVGCGSGRALVQMAQRFPQSHFTGYDISPEAIATAKEIAENAGLTNLAFQVQDLSTMADVEQFDVITAFDIVHDQAKPQDVLEAIRSALKPEGTFLMQDIRASSQLENNLSHPLGPFLYTISTMHCMTVSLAQDGAGLGTVWGQELALVMLDKAGFLSVEVCQLPHDELNSYFVCS